MNKKFVFPALFGIVLSLAHPSRAHPNYCQRLSQKKFGPSSKTYKSCTCSPDPTAYTNYCIASSMDGRLSYLFETGGEGIREVPVLAGETADFETSRCLISRTVGTLDGDIDKDILHFFYPNADTCILREITRHELTFDESTKRLHARVIVSEKGRRAAKDWVTDSTMDCVAP